MEIEIIKFIQSMSIPNTLWGDIMDTFWLFITFFGEFLVVALALLVIYWCVDKKLGEYAMFCVFCSSTFSFSLKSLVSRPRPIFQNAGDIRHLKVDNFLVDTEFSPTSYSFPSGHVTNSGTLYLSVATYIKKRWATIIAIVLTVLIAISRLYIGVHYPTDVLAGLVIAFTVAYGLGWLFNEFSQYKYFIILGVAIVALIMAIITGEVKLWGLAGAGIGYFVCAQIEAKYVKCEVDSVWWKRIIRFFVGLAIGGAVFFVFSLFIPLQGVGITAIMALVIGAAVLLVPYCFKLLKI